MTKLMQWLFVLAVYGIVYACTLTNVFPLDLNENSRILVAISPIILVALFGIFSIIVISYRVATFKDCTDAAIKLKEEIVVAKKDLASKGMKFD